MRSKVFFWMLPFIFSIVVAFPVILPYFNPGYFPTHDGEWAVVRLADMFRTLRDFQIPARYSGNLNFGYGYPLFNFVYPFPYYFGTFFHFLGIGFVDSIKIMFAASVPLSAFFMFLASRILWKNTLAGIISAIMYIYFPYRMVDLYVRGSIGESLSFALFPLLFYLAIKLIGKSSFLLVGGIAVSVASLIMTHNIMSILFIPLYIVFILIQAILKNKKAIRRFFLSIFLGLGISAFFWVPAIFEKSNILLSQIPIADRNLYFVTLSQFLFPRWGYGVPTDPNGFSYQLGIPHLTVLFLTAFIMFRSYLKTRHSGDPDLIGRLQNLDTAFSLIGLALVFIFFLFRHSAFLWEHLQLLSEINYPWTTLGTLGFLSSLLAGFLCGQKITRYIAVALSLVAVVLVLPYAKPQYLVDRGDNFYLTNDATTTSSNELMPLWVKKIPSERPAEKVEVFGQGKVENVSYNSKQILFSVDLLSQSTVRINTIYYPGWKAYIDNQSVAISYTNEQGVMDVGVPVGRHKIEASLGETPVRLIGDAISLVSFITLFLMAGVSKYKRKIIR